MVVRLLNLFHMILWNRRYKSECLSRWWSMFTISTDHVEFPSNVALRAHLTAYNLMAYEGGIDDNAMARFLSLFTGKF